MQTLRPIAIRKRNSATSQVRRSTATLVPIAAMLFFSAPFFLAGCKNNVAPAADVWAVVNGKEIKRDEVEKYYRTRISAEGQEPSQEEALSLKLNVIDELINNEILLERAKKLNIEASDGEVEDEFTSLKSPYTEDEFQRQLKERGVTVEDLKNTVRRELSIKKLINREVVSKVTISDQDIEDFYNANRPQFNVAEPQYRIAQIVVTPRKEPQIRNRKNDDATNEAEAQRKIKMLVDRLNSGADFSQLAMDYSEDMNSSATGGDLGFVPESSLNQSDPTLKRIVLGLKAGQVSQPIVLKDSIRILKLVLEKLRDCADFPNRKCSRLFATPCAIAKSSCCAPRIWQWLAMMRGSRIIWHSRFSKRTANCQVLPSRRCHRSLSLHKTSGA